jgi:hypothetical protein
MPSAWQGAWLGIWPGDWFGEQEAGGGTIVNAALVVVGSGSAQFGAVVEGGTPVEEPAPGAGFTAPYRRRFYVNAALVVDGIGRARSTATVLAPALGRTSRRRRVERELLLAA